MTHANDPGDSPQDTEIGRDEARDVERDAADTPAPAPALPARPTAEAAAAAHATPPADDATSAPTAPSASNLAELSAQLREAAAEIAEIAAQAGRLGIAIDAASALREGTTPEALRRRVLQRAADASDARDVLAAASPVLPTPAESPIIAAAKRAAASGSRR